MFSILFFISCIEDKKVLLERPYLKKEIQIEEKFDAVNFEFYLDTLWVDMIDSLSLEDYLRNTSKNPIAYYDRANFIFQQSKFNLNTDISILDESEIIILENIKNDLLKSIDLIDSIAEAQFLLSKVFYIQNEFEKSLTYSNNSIELYPNDNNYKDFRCMVWKSNGRQDLSYNFYRAKLDDVIGNLDMLIKPMVVRVKNEKTNF